MRARIIPAFLILVSSFPCCGQILAATIVDPQEHVIVGAKVLLNCPRSKAIAFTDVQGRFSFDIRSGVSGCELNVSYPGFESYHQALGDVSRPMLIRLKVASLRESINVDANKKESSLTGHTYLTSITLSDLDLKMIAGNTHDAIRRAKILAGTTLKNDVIYVDGLPTNIEPPLETIARITVNGDPFSAEFSQSDQNRIEITTKSPERKFRFSFGGASLGLGGRSVLDPNLDSASHGGSFNLSGPIPHTPLTFSLQANLGYERQDQPILAVVPANLSNQRPALDLFSNSSVYNDSVSLSAHYWKSETLRGNLFFNQSQFTSSNTNAGALTLPEAGSNVQSSAREIRATIEKDTTDYIYRGGFVINDIDTHIAANTSTMGLMVPGAFIGGGSSIADSRAAHTSWTVKSVFYSHSNERAWDTGIVLSRFIDSDIATPNPNGLMRFENLKDYADALTGGRTGTWFLSRGNGNLFYASTTFAAFAEGEPLHFQNAILRVGLRADYQSARNMVLSPRLSAATNWRGFILRGGTGLFVQDLPNSIFTQTMESDGFHLEQFMTKGVSLTSFPEIPSNSQGLVISRISSDLVRPRNLMIKTSIERRFGSLTNGVDYTWIDGLHLLGSRRLAAVTGWSDVLESNRTSVSHKLHARVQWEWKGQSILAHYEFIRSLDNTEGPFSFPARQDDLQAEWARTAGVSPHNLELVISSKLPKGIQTSIIASFRSAAPYNLTSEADVTGDGLYNDRAGRSRNSGIGPGYKSLALYAYRRTPLPRLLIGSKTRLVANVGLQADNLLSSKNYLNLGQIIGSPLFGIPLGALPGRSFKLWVNFDQ